MAMRLLAILAPLPLLAACSGGAGQQYAIAPDEALTRLHNLDDAGFIANRRCGANLSMSAETLDAATIKWSINADGTPGPVFTVHVEPGDKGQSRVIIALPKDPAGGEIYDGDKKYDHPLVQQPLRASLEELVAAALESRKFDPARIKTSVSDDVCVIQRQTSGSDRIHIGSGRPGPGPASNAAPVVDAWGSPTNPSPGNFGSPAMGQPAAPQPPAPPPAGAPPPPPPPRTPPGQPQPLIN
ncbi:MAG: hypothetical protein JSS36_12525 [Proteobacteria bacterium]|nr:hypothetical protein [Pseudomonadota bacterium]